MKPQDELGNELKPGDFVAVNLDIIQKHMMYGFVVDVQEESSISLTDQKLPTNPTQKQSPVPIHSMKAPGRLVIQFMPMNNFFSDQQRTFPGFLKLPTPSELQGVKIPTPKIPNQA